MLLQKLPSSFSRATCRRFHKNVRSVSPTNLNRNSYSTQSPKNERKFIDLRSDTVTKPCEQMLQSIHSAEIGDDVLNEDKTVLKLQEYVADVFNKEKGLFVPTGTMSNLVAILSHCSDSSSNEMIIGSQSHINLWEGGGMSNLAGVSTKQIQENDDGTLDAHSIRDFYRTDDDDHFAKTKLICLENTHNMMGGATLTKEYIDSVSNMAKTELDPKIKLHIDGARIFHASTSLGIDIKDLCHSADSVSICLSKGLGAPLGSVLVGDKEFIRIAKRARKRCGGGMRQVGVVACMGMFAIQNNVERLEEDHERAKRLATSLYEAGFYQPQDGKVQSNIVYFGLPQNSNVSKEELCLRLREDYGILFGGGYNKGGELFRLVTHKDVDDEDIDRAIESIINLCLSRK